MAAKTDKKKSNKPVISLKESPKNMVGSDDLDFMNILMNDMYACTILPKDTPQDVIDMRINAALETLRQIAPRDGVEGMLAVQMANTHRIASECLRRASIPEQTFEGRNLNLKHAEKFLRLYMDQVKTLSKMRGQGDQKMVIEHVNIEPGGQAIVGQVERKSQKSKNDT